MVRTKVITDGFGDKMEVMYFDNIKEVILTIGRDSEDFLFTTSNVGELKKIVRFLEGEEEQ